jgi:hypothetical protein
MENQFLIVVSSTALLIVSWSGSLLLTMTMTG